MAKAAPLAPPQDAERYIVPGLQRGIQILRAFDRQRTQLGAPEIARELGIPRSTVFRLMQTLEYMGLLEKIDHSSDYRLGIGVLSLGFEYLASMEVTELARPILDRLRDETGFSSHLAIRDGTDMVFVVKSAAKAAFASSVTIGTRFPAHATILGRVMLADLTDTELQDVYPTGKLPRYSDQTPETLTALKAILEGDASRGYALSAAYFEHGIGSIAAPVRDSSGRVIAAINVIFQDGKVEKDQYIDRVLQATSDLSRQLNYHPAVNKQERLTG
jgi:DNA-binding IclR family transcriptional regulator